MPDRTGRIFRNIPGTNIPGTVYLFNIPGIFRGQYTYFVDMEKKGVRSLRLGAQIIQGKTGAQNYSFGRVNRKCATVFF